MAMGDPGAPPPQAPATFEKVDKTFNLTETATRIPRSECRIPLSGCFEKVDKAFK